MPKQLAKTDGYKQLVKKIQSELSELDFLIKRRTAETYWRIGKYIHEHILENKDRADYGKRIFYLLSEDVDRDESTLRKMHRFYCAYPIQASWPELSWSHYRLLMAVKDKDKRDSLEKQIIEKNWDAEKLQNYLNFKKSQLAVKDDPDKPIIQLAFTRGRVDVFEAIKDDDKDNEGQLVIDFGFRQSVPLPEGAKFKEGDLVQIVRDNNGRCALKVDIEKNLIYTYKAQVNKVIDGDTLWVRLGIEFGIAVRQKLRLRGIDCPEMDTEEGARAKKFVESKLKKCDFIVVKTYKDTTDKYDRYLADVFYLKGESDPSKVAEQGVFLNQELLDRGLARLWE